ncbi:optic atrophy 3 protein homolog isoform X2 [Homarus americanus]|uniref:optic atrophy 3 protein homolog isoform X2 n=1 Tax=Homarus americanus TaxID=6706 RepID=UPI001C4903F3|nr:optic atrophy 3 protein homolog isoform X2 [Homarus americanus]XP_042240464.1 optic atrophy 3 protein homolog isoform X2 [Homarus americanus]
MAPVFPLAKLAFLFVKQVARPLSSSIKRKAGRSHFFKENFCLPPARLYHWCEVRMKMYVMNIGRSGQSSTIPKLNEDAAIELGANLLGEGVIFGIAVGILAFEVIRQKEKEKKKDEDEQAFINSLENRINELTFASEELDTKLRELTRNIYAVQHQIKMKETKAAVTSKTTDVVLHSSSHSGTSSGVIVTALMYAKSRIFENTPEKSFTSVSLITTALLDAKSKICG